MWKVEGGGRERREGGREGGGEGGRSGTCIDLLLRAEAVSIVDVALLVHLQFGI